MNPRLNVGERISQFGWQEMELEKEHLTEREVADFQRRMMTPAERRRLDAHVAACAACLQLILEPSHSHLAFTSLSEAFMPLADEEPFHLSHEELKRYQTEDLDEADRTIFESHLEICSECNRKADKLQSVAVGPGVVAAESADKSGWLSAFRRPLFWTPARAIAVIAAVGCVLFILALLLQKRSTTQPHEQAAQTEPRDSGNPAPLPTGDVAGSNKNESAPDEVNQDSPNNSSTGPEVSASPAILRLKDGETEVSLDAQGNLNGLEKLSPQTQKAVQTALASERLTEPQILGELSGPKINLMGGAGEGLPFNLITPVRAVISTNRPTLRWQPLEGTTSYVASVFDSNFNLVAKSSPQSATEWSVPVSLQNGRVYSWEVTALKGNQEITAPIAPAPRAQFKVLEAGKINEISSVRKHLPLSHLTLGVLYARAGLLSEAEREFSALVKDNPRSDVAKRLLRTVQTWRSR